MDLRPCITQNLTFAKNSTAQSLRIYRYIYLMLTVVDVQPVPGDRRWPRHLSCLRG